MSGPSNPGAIPRIRFGEIKNVRSYNRGLRQLATRRGTGNTALALYDDSGNVHLQVFTPQPDGVSRLAFDSGIGRVPVPRTTTGAPIRPGTAPFGNAIEASILGLLARVTGQQFRPKRPNAHGPDIVGR